LRLVGAELADLTQEGGEGWAVVMLAAEVADGLAK
jgi:hypothetical protein